VALALLTLPAWPAAVLAQDGSPRVQQPQAAPNDDDDADDAEIGAAPTPPGSAPRATQARDASDALPPPASASPPTVPAPAPAPAPEPGPAAPAAAVNAPAPPAPATAQASGDTAGATAALGVPSATAPAGDEIAPRSLIAEGSNYVRPIRRGLRWWGFVQGQYQTNQLSEDQLGPDGESRNFNEFSLRRARLRIDRGWEYAAATLELDATTLNGFRVFPRRAEGSLLYRGPNGDDVTPLLVLTAGVTDLPFGAEIGESQRDRVFMERSIGSLALFPSEADAGIKLWGVYGFLNYALAVVNGQPLVDGVSVHDPNDAKDIVGRVGTHASLTDALGLEGGLSFYNGRGFSPGRLATKDSINWVDDNNNGFAEPFEFQGVTGSAAVPSQNFRRWALGLDLTASQRTSLGVTRLGGELVVASNLDRGLLVSDPVASGSDVRQLVLNLFAVQQITDYGLIGLRASFYDPNSDAFEQRAGTFHIKRKSFWVISPAVGLTLPHGRLVAQYDFISDAMARDTSGVPTDAKNNVFTVRLQVDL
jgi:hypothetical protein